MISLKKILKRGFNYKLSMKTELSDMKLDIYAIRTEQRQCFTATSGKLEKHFCKPFIQYEENCYDF